MPNYLIIPALAVITSFIHNKSHLLTSLILIEFMEVITITGMFDMTSKNLMENFAVIYFLIILMVESVLGMSLMINMVRTHGNDLIKSSMIVK
uniref:NADH dehydrogenase subunit 4L n=1 Tax=Singhiella simplex TaxID=1608328 RepID=A0A7G2CUB6_9HEMI|nr:NADH dehydrogenase subunit 4L [Singhiella simplex]